MSPCMNARPVAEAGCRGQSRADGYGGTPPPWTGPCAVQRLLRTAVWTGQGEARLVDCGCAGTGMSSVGFVGNGWAKQPRGEASAAAAGSDTGSRGGGRGQGGLFCGHDLVVFAYVVCETLREGGRGDPGHGLREEALVVVVGGEASLATAEGRLVVDGGTSQIAASSAVRGGLS